MSSRCCLALVLSSCGAYHTPSRDATADTTHTSGQTTEDFPLDERREVPGTAVSLCAPRGSELMHEGAGFVHRQRRVQILVVASDGPARIHEQALAGVASDAQTLSEEDIEVNGTDSATLVVDRQITADDLELERVRIWLRAGTRSVLVIAAYAAERSERLRGLVAASLRTVSIVASQQLDPERTMNAHLAPPPGLQLSRRTTSVLRYVAHEMDATSDLPAATLSIFPIQFHGSAEEARAQCSEMLEAGSHIESAQIQLRSLIQEADVSGCELRAQQNIPSSDTETFPAETYAALIWTSARPFFVVGMSPASAPQTGGLAAFAQAARSLRVNLSEAVR